MDDHKFTFEDWKEGKLPPPPKSDRIGSPNFTQKEIRESEGLWPLYWTYLADSPRMEQNTYQKITVRQQEAYFSAAETNVFARIILFFERINGFSLMQKQEYFEIEKELIENRLTDKVLVAKIQRGIFQEYIITPDIHKDIRTTIEWIKKSNKPVVRSCRHGTDTEGWCGNLDRFKLKGDFPTFVNLKYKDMLIQLFEDHVKKIESESSSGEKKGNQPRLHTASEWMDPLVRDIGNLPLQKEEGDVLSLLKDVYPKFREEFDFSQLGLPFIKNGKNINKESISKALVFIFKKKTGMYIKKGAIKKRYGNSGLGYW